MTFGKTNNIMEKFEIKIEKECLNDLQIIYERLDNIDDGTKSFSLMKSWLTEAIDSLDSMIQVQSYKDV